MKLTKTRKITVKKSAAPVVARQETPAAPAANPAVTVPARPVAPPPATSSMALKVASPALPSATSPVTVKTTPPATPARPVTVIEAKIDVGFGNQLFVRGQGAGLSWERGTPLTCVGPDTWRWTVEATDRLQFKLLLNDRVWAKGEDVVVPPGKQVELKPAFSE